MKFIFNFKSLLFVSLAFVTLSGCNNTKGSGDLSVSLKGSKVYLVDTSVKSCKALADENRSGSSGSEDLSALSFKLPELTISTADSHPVRIIYIDVRLTGDGLSSKSYTNCKIANDALASAFTQSLSYMNQAGNVIPDGLPIYVGADLVFPVVDLSAKQAQYGKKTICELRCGGVTIADPTRNTSGSGRVIVYAQDLQDDVPLIADAFIQWEYAGTGQ